jgi:sentrin-specific protease 1
VQLEKYGKEPTEEDNEYAREHTPKELFRKLDLDAKVVHFYQREGANPELSSRSIVEFCLSPHLNQDECVVEIGGLRITREQMQCLAPMEWINSDVINAYLVLLKQREARASCSKVTCHFFDSFFYRCLVVNNQYAFREWTSFLPYSILDCDRIFFPIHHVEMGEDCHWALAMVDLKQKRLEYFDSLSFERPEILRFLARYLDDEAACKGGPVLDVQSWKIECRKNIPKQVDGHSCGLFLLRFADLLSADADIDFSGFEVDSYRKELICQLWNRSVP